jgi:RNA polymerase sigma factor (sigma-70 family)
VNATSRDSSSAAHHFESTRWDIVSAAAKTGAEGADSALEQLCLIYWRPLYAFVRRRGHQPCDAKDLTQAFFVRLLQHDFLRAVDPRKGKFRSFLLAALEHFMAKEWRRAHAQKRGGGIIFTPLEEMVAEQEYQQASTRVLSPEQLYDRQWALTLLQQVLAGLRQEYVTQGNGSLFDAIKAYLTLAKNEHRYAELAAATGKTEAALKMAVSRLRKRYGEALRAEIARTVSGPDEVEEEMRALYTALG